MSTTLTKYQKQWETKRRNGTDVAWNKGKTKEEFPQMSNSGVKKGNISGNRGKKGQIPWNKGKVGVQVSWNKCGFSLLRISETDINNGSLKNILSEVLN